MSHKAAMPVPLGPLGALWNFPPQPLWIFASQVFPAQTSRHLNGSSRVWLSLGHPCQHLLHPLLPEVHSVLAVGPRFSLSSALPCGEDFLSENVFDCSQINYLMCL